MADQKLTEYWNNPYHITIVALIVAFSLIGGLIFGGQADLAAKNDLRQYMLTIQPMIKLTMINSLQGNPKDYDNPEWQQLYSRLSQLAKTKPDLVNLYLARIDNNQIIFLLNTTPDQFSNRQQIEPAVPGQNFHDAPAEIWSIFDGQKVQIIGPYNSKWGRLFSAYIPIRDQRGKIIGLLGSDIGADNTINQVFGHQLTSLVIGLYFIVLYFVWLRFRRKLKTV